MPIDELKEQGFLAGASLKTILTLIGIGVSIGVTYATTQLQIISLGHTDDRIEKTVNINQTHIQSLEIEMAVMKRSIEYLVRTTPASSTELQDMRKEILTELRAIEAARGQGKEDK